MESDLIYLFSSPVLYVLINLLAHGGPKPYLELLNSKFRIEDNSLLYSNRELSVQINDEREHKNKGIAALKVLIGILAQINIDAAEYRDAQFRLVQNKTVIDTRRFAEWGIYKASNAVRYVKEILDSLRCVYISVILKDGTKVFVNQPLICGYTAKGEYIVIELNTNIKWEYILKHLMPVPVSFFSMDKTTAVLMLSVFYFIRTNFTKTKQVQYEAQLSTICRPVGLPMCKATYDRLTLRLEEEEKARFDESVQLAVNPTKQIKNRLISSLEKISSNCPDLEIDCKAVKSGTNMDRCLKEKIVYRISGQLLKEYRKVLKNARKSKRKTAA